MPLNYSKQTIDRVKNLGINSENDFNVVLDFFENRSKNESEITETNTELVSKISELNSENSKLKSELENLHDELRKLRDEYTKVLETIPDGNSERNPKYSEIISKLCSEFSIENPEHLSEQLLDKFGKIASENRKLSEEISKKSEKSALNFSPFSERLLELTAQRLSEKYGKQIHPESVLQDMFLRYTIERNAEWFYPWVISKNELVQIAHEFNDKITSYNQIKTIIGK